MEFHSALQKQPEIVQRTISCKNSEDITLNEIVTKMQALCDPTYIRYLDHIKRWKVLEMHGSTANRMWIYFIQQHRAPRNGQNYKFMDTYLQEKVFTRVLKYSYYSFSFLSSGKVKWMFFFNVAPARNCREIHFMFQAILSWFQKEMKDQQLVRTAPKSSPRPNRLTDTEYQRYCERRHQQQPPVTWEPSVLKLFAKIVGIHQLRVLSES